MNWTRFNEALLRRIASSKKGSFPILVEQAKGLVRQIMDLTPPGSNGRPGLSQQSHNAGKQAIFNDLYGGGGRSKHQRTAGIFTPMKADIVAKAAAMYGSERAITLFPTKEGIVYGVEHELFFPHPAQDDMREHHKRYYRNGRFTRAGGATRDIGRWRFIDKFVLPKEDFTAYIKTQYAKVGYLMSGWRVAARELGINLPKWVANNNAPGVAKINIGSKSMDIVIRNNVAWASTRIPDRRIQAAIDRQASKMASQFQYYLDSL